VTTAFLNGWSTKFHFSPFPSPQHTIEASLAFYEHRLAHIMDLQPHHIILDVGCGVGGPAREIARFIGCRVVGISNNQRHIDIAIQMTAEAGLSHQCTFVKGDFMKLNETFAEGSFDAAYATEATVHAPSLPDVYASIASILKPNGVFGLWEWVLTPKFDYTNPQHIGIRNRIERGNALSNLVTITECRDAYLKAGFEIYHDHDYANHFDFINYPPPPVTQSPYSTVTIPFAQTYTHLSPTTDPTLAPPPSTTPIFTPPTMRPWHFPLTGNTSLSTCKEDYWTCFKMARVPRKMSWILVSMMEAVGLAPRGTRKLSKTMEYCVDSVVEGGKEGVFSPLWWVVGRKVGKVEGASGAEGSDGPEAQKESEEAKRRNRKRGAVVNRPWFY
jgi:sterol 24-C-methyltransferase